jgi:hypothetical protein
MTTIAANLEMMVADSKVSDVGDAAYSYSAHKIVRFKDGIAGAEGDGGNCMRFLLWAANNFTPPTPVFSKAEFSGLILNSGGLFIFDQTYPCAERLYKTKHFAIGSGSQAARAAMSLGRSPIHAVRLACRLDDGSGLPLQILRLRK